ncbi:putative lysylphosphatidylglycerol synthetase [Trichinella spiralis]|uniref:putative lysylphosphatidylglycerol synthetase n=1 Tax=Trichinella spiralis TaxID=6334 RepID=UPI0001EFD32C|nr:putative lysylphosphatidylglycerol synthetase [Trichinella spiralis]
MLQTHKCHINIAITGTCIRQPFTISYMLKFICMLNAIICYVICVNIIRVGSVGKEIYIILTEEERQYLIRLMLLHCVQAIITRWYPYSYRFSSLTQSTEPAQNEALLQ